MKAKQIIMPAKRSATLEDFELDETLAPNQILLKTHYSLISPGTEGAGYTGLESGTRFPHGSGYTAIGEVLKVGEHVTKCAVGDYAFCYSSHASIIKTASVMLAFKQPLEMDAKLIPFVRMATVAMTSLRVSSVEFGDTAVIIGLGLVGNSASQLFNLAGMKVISVERVPERIEIARKCGIQHLINPDEEDVLERVKSLTDGHKAEVTVEAIGNPRLVELAYQLTRTKGEVILLGSPRGEYITNATAILNYSHLIGLGAITLRSAHEWVYPTMHSGESKHSLERNSQIVYSLIKEGKFKVEELLTHVINPEDAQSAYDGLTDHKDKYLGVIMDWTQV
ncbi:MAG: zinc-binding alcohol dehydrogenase [Candidatus Poribacteria bacterium]|nr:zinc-binding alcohol dehydrogenase [Candidatus Poribacteria bacterium]